MLNYYSVLGVSPRATPSEIKTAYRESARKTHPDHGGDADDFAEVRAAYDTLSDDLKRSDYESTYRAHAKAHQAEVCEACFAAQIRTADPACRLCGERWPGQGKRTDEKRSAPLPPRVEKLKNDLLDRLGDAAIDVGARIGDEIADVTLSTVHQGLDLLARKLGRQAGRRKA